MKAMWLLLVPTLAQAKAPAPKPVSGLTVDGTALVYTAEARPSEDDETPCLVNLEKVRDLGTQQETSYVRSWDCMDHKAPPKVLGKPWADFEAFVKAHPLSTLEGTQGPRGGQVVALQASCATLRCGPTRCEVKPDGTGKGCPDAVDGRVVGSLTVGIKRADGRVYPAMSFEVGDIYGEQAETLQLSWLADESAVGLLRYRTTTRGRDGESEWTATLLRFAPVRVRVLAYQPHAVTRDLEALAEKAAAPLRGLGYSVSVGLTKDPRTDTVVYAAAGFEADAAKIAKAVPGARVEKLTWKADAEVVVAVAAK